MKCPNCNIDLVMSERQNVEIDYCPQCRGVWLDKGELDKIIDRTSPVDNGPSTNDQYDQYGKERKDYSQGKYYPHKKKKGFLGDLFDFD